MVMRLRKATEDDGDTLAALILENQSVSTSYEMQPLLEADITSMIVDILWKQDKNIVYVFHEDNKFVGACFHEFQSGVVVNNHLHIHKDFRGKGYAQKLLTMDAAACSMFGLKILSMVPENNIPLITSMRKAGYVDCGIVPNCWNHDGKLIARVVLFKE